MTTDFSSAPDWVRDAVFYQVFVRSFADSAVFQTALKEGRYLGGLERVQGLYPALTIAVPILVEGPEDSAAPLECPA